MMGTSLPGGSSSFRNSTLGALRKAWLVLVILEFPRKGDDSGSSRGTVSEG